MFIGKESIIKKKEEKDLGATIMDNMSPKKHSYKIIGETDNLLRNIRVTFTSVDEDMIKKLITTLVRPRLDYVATIWSSSGGGEKKKKKKHKKNGENTELPTNLREMSYKERLQILGFITLEQRMERGNIIAVYRVMKGLEKL